MSPTERGLLALLAASPGGEANLAGLPNRTAQLWARKLIKSAGKPGVYRITKLGRSALATAAEGTPAKPKPTRRRLATPEQIARQVAARTSTFWHENDAKLRHLAEVEGLTTAEAAERLGVTKNAVIGRGHRIGVQWARDSRHPVPGKPEGWTFPESGRCVWPHGHPREARFGFCCGPVAQPGAAYCDTHRARAYQLSSAIVVEAA